MISRILRHIPEMDNPYFDARLQIKPEDRKIGYIVVSADKGLAGAYNHNVFKLVEEQLEKPGTPPCSSWWASWDASISPKRAFPWRNSSTTRCRTPT